MRYKVTVQAVINCAANNFQEAAEIASAVIRGEEKPANAQVGTVDTVKVELA